jgi:hypothetical protein
MVVSIAIISSDSIIFLFFLLGLFGLAGFLDDALILVVVFLHLAALYRTLLVYRHGGT